MHRPHQQLTRKCAVCGQIKPLTAFLASGNTYGDVCLECRAKEAESDERGSTSKGLRVDDKTKKLAELEQKKRLNELNESKIEHIEKRDKLETETKDKKERVASSEKKHREQYIDINKALQTPDEKKRAAAKRATQESAKSEATETDILINRQNQEAGTQQEIGAKTERVKTGIDLTAPFTGQQVPQSKYQSAEFLKFAQWLGPSAHGIKAFTNPATANKTDAAKTVMQALDNKAATEKTLGKTTQESTPSIKTTMQINLPPLPQQTKTEPQKMPLPEQFIKPMDVRSSNLYQPAPKTEGPKQPADGNKSLADRMKNVWGPRK